MPSMVETTCACGCGRKKMVRTADVKRGWGKFYSKSCKAKEQERRTGQYSDMLDSGYDPEDPDPNWDQGDDLYWSGKDD